MDNGIYNRQSSFKYSKIEFDRTAGVVDYLPSVAVIR